MGLGRLGKIATSGKTGFTDKIRGARLVLATKDTRKALIDRSIARSFNKLDPVEFPAADIEVATKMNIERIPLIKSDGQPLEANDILNILKGLVNLKDTMLVFMDPPLRFFIEASLVMGNTFAVESNKVLRAVLRKSLSRLGIDNAECGINFPEARVSKAVCLDKPEQRRLVPAIEVMSGTILIFINLDEKKSQAYIESGFDVIYPTEIGQFGKTLLTVLKKKPQA